MRLPHGLAPPAEESPCPECLGDADEDLGLGLAAALTQVAQADPRVDQHRHDARFEQGEDQREEVEPGPDHHHGPRAAADPDRLEAMRDPIAVPIELPVSQVRVADAAAAVSPVRHDDGHACAARAWPSQLRWMAMFDRLDRSVSVRLNRHAPR